MFQPSSDTKNILPISNPSVTQNSALPNYNWQKWAKWSLASAGGAVLTTAVFYYGGPVLWAGLSTLIAGASRFSKDSQSTALSQMGRQTTSVMNTPHDVSSTKIEYPPHIREFLDRERNQQSFLGELEAYTQKNKAEVFFEDLIDSDQPSPEANEDDEDNKYDDISSLFSDINNGEDNKNNEHFEELGGNDQLVDTSEEKKKSKDDEIMKGVDDHVTQKRELLNLAKRSGQPPVLVNNTLTAKQGEAVIITNNNLAATDVDDNNANLVFMITELQHGQFENVNNPGIAISAFTQQQITDGKICFVHDGSDIAPLCKVIVNDGTSMTEPSMPQIEFIGLGELSNVINVGSCGSRITVKPFISGLSNGRFAISWACSSSTKGKIFNLIDLSESGGFDLPNSARPKITGLQNGRFVVVYGRSNDIRGQLLYGDGTLDGEDFLVGTSCNALGPLHDVAGSNKFLIVWAGTNAYVYGTSYHNNGTVFSSFQISTSIVECSTGYMENMSAAELINGDFVVVYSNHNRVYAQIINTEGNKQSNEILVVNTIGKGLEDYGESPLVTGLGNEGFVVVWSDAESFSFIKYGKLFNATGFDYTGVQQLNNEYSTGPGLTRVENNKFVLTYADLQSQCYDTVSMRIFYNDATIFHPGMIKIQDCISYTDGTDVSNLEEGKFCITWSSEFTVYMKLLSTKNIAPQMIVNHLTINEGETQILINNTLDAIDVDNYDPIITFLVSDVQHGRFTTVADPITTITSFSQLQIDNREIQFIHDGGENAPSYKVSASCGGLQTSPTPADISFTNINDISVLGNNQLIIMAGEDVIFNSGNLSGTDIDDDDALLIFTISDLQHGQFEFINNNTVTNSFRQQQITDSNIHFVHDGGEYPPSYRVTISDGKLTTLPAPAYILFNPQMTPVPITSDVQLASASSPVLVSRITDDRFAAIWQCSDGNGQGVCGKIFSRTGTPINSEFIVNSYTTGDQTPTGIADIPSTGIVAAWQSNGQDGDGLGAYAQVITIDGIKSGPEVQLAVDTIGNQYQPKVVALNSNQYVATWTSDHVAGFNYGYGRVIDIDGTHVGSEFRTSSYFENHYPFAIGVNSNNEFYIVYRCEANRDGDQSGIFAQKFMQDTTKIGSEFQMNNYTVGRQDFSDITLIPATDNIVVVWQSEEQGGMQDIRGQFFYSDNSKFGEEILINEFTTNNQEKPSIVALSNDTLISVWQSNGQDGSGYGIYGRRYSDKGVKNGYEFRINEYTSGNQYFDLQNSYKTIAKLNEKEFVVVWYSQSQTGVYARIFSIESTQTTAAPTTPMPTTTPSTTAASTTTPVPTTIPPTTAAPTTHTPTTMPPMTAASTTPISFTRSLSSGATFFTNQQSQQELSDSNFAGRNNVGVIIGGVIGGCIVLCIVGGGAGYLLYRRNRSDYTGDIEILDITPKVEKRKSARMSMIEGDDFLQLIPKSKIKFENMLGKGAFAEVYKGRWKGAEIAVKQLPMHVIEFDPQAIKEFEREASLMNQLKHPSIVQFYGICKSNEYYCLVMEYMQNGSLDKILYDNGISLPWIPIRLQIMKDITYGLAYLHDQGIFHRDLKSPNILLDKEMRAKLTDFGISKIIEGGASKTMTKGVGTVCWMAPEIMESKEGKMHYTIKADVYSYGIILWELAAREEPYKELTQFKIPSAVFRGARPKIPQDSPLSYACLIERCWAQRADDRPTMATVEEELESIETELVAMNEMKHSV